MLGGAKGTLPQTTKTLSSKIKTAQYLPKLLPFHVLSTLQKFPLFLNILYIT